MKNVLVISHNKALYTTNWPIFFIIFSWCMFIWIMVKCYNERGSKCEWIGQTKPVHGLPGSEARAQSLTSGVGLGFNFSPEARPKSPKWQPMLVDQRKKDGLVDQKMPCVLVVHADPICMLSGVHPERIPFLITFHFLHHRYFRFAAPPYPSPDQSVLVR